MKDGTSAFGSKPKAPFEVILVWKFSRFNRKREHAVVLKSQLRRKGIRVVSITEQAEDNATDRPRLARNQTQHHGGSAWWTIEPRVDRGECSRYQTTEEDFGIDGR